MTPPREAELFAVLATGATVALAGWVFGELGAIYVGLLAGGAAAVYRQAATRWLYFVKRRAVERSVDAELLRECRRLSRWLENDGLPIEARRKIEHALTAVTETRLAWSNGRTEAALRRLQIPAGFEMLEAEWATRSSGPDHERENRSGTG